MDKIEELRLKKRIKEYEYLLTEFDFRKEYSDKWKSPFLNEISKRRKELGLTDPFPQDPPQEDSLDLERSKQEGRELETDEIDVLEESEEESKETSSKEKRLKTIFREVVKVCHPDKLRGSNRKKHFTEIYLRSKNFYNTKNIIGLLLICVELGIDLRPETEDLNEIDGVINVTKSQIDMYENSYLWMWIHAEEEKKIEIIDLFIKNNG